MLGRTAIEHEGRCTWISTTQDLAFDGVSLAFRSATVDASLYGGTSGIALFLAETWRLTGEARFRELARAAVRHALRRAPALHAQHRLGFYDGLIGIAYAALRVGRLTDTPELEDYARALLAPLVAADFDIMGLDVIDGAAGAAPALLLLAQWLKAPEYAALARHLGDRIVAGARKTDGGWSWAFGASRAEEVDGLHLTGLSHGASGMGWALIELYAAIGEHEFRNGALEAFRYEDRWFRPTEDNWPDFRDHAGDPALAACAMGWCHGAPGIGLTRLRALELENDPHFRVDAERAVRGVRRRLSGHRWTERDFSPCHGGSGLCEFLLEAADVLNDAAARRLALRVAGEAAQRHAHAPDGWPGGVQRGPNPSLMIGSAGIGYFFLRIADPDIPTLLLVGPDGC
jgi:lantibiotic modifying enzyme